MSRRLSPLYALRAFEAAARHSSFTRAAEELLITQSAAHESPVDPDHALVTGAPQSLSPFAAGQRGAIDQRLDECRFGGFNDEPFDCAVLLSNGHFPPDWEASPLKIKFFPVIPKAVPDQLQLIGGQGRCGKGAEAGERHSGWAGY